jgi:hypothetical protein
MLCASGFDIQPPTLVQDGTPEGGDLWDKSVCSGKQGSGVAMGMGLLT